MSDQTLNNLIDQLIALREADPANGEKNIALQTCVCEPHAFIGNNAYTGTAYHTKHDTFLKEECVDGELEKTEDVIVIEAF